MEKVRKVMNKEDRNRKNDRLVFDGSIKFNWNPKPVNSMTHVKFEPKDDDATGAFRQCKLHLGIAQVFSFIIELILFVPCGNIFGSSTSPASWEPNRRAREAIAKRLFTDQSLIEKHKDHTNTVQFGPLPTEDTVFAQAVAGSQHKGVMDSNGNPVPTPHN
eukprot:12967617-Ditylum_brightwellii.AAC.1